MAHVTLLNFPASALIGDNDAQLVAGDVGAPHASFLGRPVLSFDATAEEAALTPSFSMPGQYAGGTLIATLHLFAASEATNGAVFDVFVEAVTPDTDTLDLEAASGWDTANSAIIEFGATTAGDAVDLQITLANKDSVAAGDLVRLGVRRDTDSGDDDASGDIFLTALELWEST